MSKLVLKTEVEAPAGVVWQGLRHFSSAASWHPFIEPGCECDEAARVMVYRLRKSPLPIEECSIEIRVDDAGAGASTVSWTGLFTVSSEHEMVAVKELQRILHGGISQIEALFGGGKRT